VSFWYCDATLSQTVFAPAIRSLNWHTCNYGASLAASLLDWFSVLFLCSFPDATTCTFYKLSSPERVEEVNELISQMMAMERTMWILLWHAERETKLTWEVKYTVPSQYNVMQTKHRRVVTNKTKIKPTVRTHILFLYLLRLRAGGRNASSSADVVVVFLVSLRTGSSKVFTATQNCNSCNVFTHSTVYKHAACTVTTIPAARILF